MSTLDKLEKLHAMIADVLADGVEACDPRLEEGDDGKSVLVGYDARLIGQAMTFLKDNDITVDLNEGADGASEVQRKLEALRGKKRADNDPFAEIPYQ